MKFFFPLQPIVRYVSWLLDPSKASWSTWRKITNLGKCLTCARSYTSYWVVALCQDSMRAPTGTDVFSYQPYRSAITDHLFSRMWRHISGQSMKTLKNCSVPSVLKFFEAVICTCSTTWNIRYVVKLNSFLNDKYCICRRMKSLLVCAITVGATLTPSVGLMWLSAMQLAVINKTCFFSPALKEPQKRKWVSFLFLATKLCLNAFLCSFCKSCV